MKESHKVLAGFSVFITGYTLLNFLFAVNPDAGVLIMWGIVLPLISIVASCKYLKSKQEEVPYWEKLAAIIFLLFIALGCMTFYIAGQIWASV